MSYTSTRRTFLQQGFATTAGVAALSLPSSQVLHALGRNSNQFLGESIPEDIRITDDPRVKEVINRALDAAKSAGASYVDVRLTHTKLRNLSVILMREGDGSLALRGGSPVLDNEEISIGVRALVKGYWGFASGPVWTVNEAVRLGKEAFRQAETNGFGKSREMALAPIPSPANGSWDSPTVIDPFGLHPNEIVDVLNGLGLFALDHQFVNSFSCITTFQRQDKAFGSTDGAYCVQRRTISGGQCVVSVADSSGSSANGSVAMLFPRLMGFELFDQKRIRESISELVAELLFDMSLPLIPIDVGRYETVLAAQAIIPFMSGTIGAATELDRTLGYEANASGTSYVNKPSDMIGTHVMASPLVTIVADRSTPYGAATVKWDDEGVLPTTVPLVTKGVLTGLQTSREGAGWLHAANSSLTPHSSGATYCSAGVDAPLPFTTNLTLQPGAESHDFESLVKQMKKGIASKDLSPILDFQQLNGSAGGSFFKVENGKRVARILGANILFRTPELWKGIRALGGQHSVSENSYNQNKGEPQRTGLHTVAGVPVLHEGLTYIDVMRKA